MKSIIQTEKECFLCGATGDLHSHHMIHGCRRDLSEKYGLKVWLCPYHHNMSPASVHFDPKLDLQMKQVAQTYFEKTHSHEEFMAIFGKNYLAAKTNS